MILCTVHEPTVVERELEYTYVAPSLVARITVYRLDV
jgi:hypothetical protein